MEDRIFLGKYRVPTTKNPQWWAAQCRQFGVTCQGEEMASGRVVVLTLVPAFLLGEPEREARRGAAREVMQIQHANLPALFEFGEEGEQFVYVAEHVQGLSARAWVDAHGPMPIATALGVVLQVADALAVAGRCQIHHAALHPGNLLVVPGQINADGWPLLKILPLFGGPPGALAPDTSNPRLAAAAAAFASPEEIAGATADFRSEFYSLGAILWFLLSAKAPEVAPERAGKKRALNLDASARFAGAPENVSRLLARMLSRDREARPPNRMALEKEIKACLSEVHRDAMLADSPSPSQPEPAAKRRTWRRLGMRFLATAGAAAMLAVAWSGINRKTTGNRSAEVSALPEESPRSVVSGVAAKKAAPEDGGGLPAAMNFAVTPPSYESASEQLRVLRSSPGTPPEQNVSRSAEPEPPAEGPDGPVVELGTEKNRAQPAKVADLVPPVISPKGDVHPRKRSAPPERN